MGPRELALNRKSVSLPPSGRRRQGESSPGACNDRRRSRLLLVEPLARKLRRPGRGASRRAVCDSGAVVLRAPCFSRGFDDFSVIVSFPSVVRFDRKTPPEPRSATWRRWHEHEP
jgi:hypothetical protein